MIMKKTLGQDWEETSRGVVFQALLENHPSPRGMLIEAKRLKDPGDFSFIYEGTISDLKHRDCVKELPKKPQTMFRYFCLTGKGLVEAKKHAEHKRTDR
jgi:hypothetical protein